MINLNFMREFPEEFRQLVLKKDPAYDVQKLFQLDEKLRSVQREAESLRCQRNLLAANVSPGGVTQEVKDQAKKINQQLKEYEEQELLLKKEFQHHYLCCPNLPLPEVPVGGKEANLVVRTYGEKPKFSFEPKHHVQLNEQVQWFDFTVGARMAGSQFVFYREKGASLIYSLALFMMQHNRSKGYELLLPPYLVNENSLEGAAQFPKFRDAVYKVDEDNLYLTPTSEVNLTNLYRDRVFNENELPVRMTSWTSCFRKEAGTYGASERGLIRIHQFEKIELYTLCTPEHAVDEHESMVACAEEILQLLGLHYRVSLLAAEDASFAAAKTYDIEVWMPGQGEYREVSSASICSDFQSRRCGIKYRPIDGAKPQLVYTLNASSLALPRLMVALMETYQKEDGSIELPSQLDQVVWRR